MSGKRHSNLPRIVVVCLILAYIIFYSGVSIYRHQGLNSSGFDLAIQDQVIWNTSRGRLFASSVEVVNFLGDHVCPIAIFLAPLAWLPGWGVEWLLIAQSAALGLAAWPLYTIARIETRGRAWPIAIVLSYLASPLPGFVNRFDFHFLAFSVPCLMTMLLYLRLRRLREATLWAVLAVICREEIGFTVAAIALVSAVAPSLRKWGLITGAAAISWALVACFVIIPYYRGGPSDSLARYGWLGNGAGEILWTMLSKPWYVFGQLVTDGQRLHTLSFLLWPLALLPFLAPIRMLCILIPLAIPMLQGHPSANSIYFHYLAPSLPLLWWAAAGGAGRWCRWASRMRIPGLARGLAPAALVLTTGIAFAVETPVTHATGPPFWEVRVGPPRPNVAEFRRAAALIGQDESVVASMAMAPHLSRREKIGIVGYARTFAQPDCYLLDVSDFRWAEHSPELAGHLAQIVRRREYGVRFWEGNLVLLRRGDGDAVDRSAVLSTLERRAGVSAGQ